MAPQKKVVKETKPAAPAAKTKPVAKVVETEEFMDLEGDDEDEMSGDEEDYEFDAETLAELEVLSNKINKKIQDPETAREKFIQKRAKVHSNGGVIVISRLPYGFFEEQLNSFFSQFGVVRKLRLSRNPKTGKSRHYAFMEFDNKEVAMIIADTMDNYMMFGRTLQCKYLPPAQVHPDTFRNHHRKFKVIPWHSIFRKAHNKERTEEEVSILQKKLLAKEKSRRAKLQAMGMDFDFAGYENKQTVAKAKKAPQSAVKADKKKKRVEQDEEEEVAPVKTAKKAKVVATPVEEAPKKAKVAAVKAAPVEEAPKKKTVTKAKK